MAENCPCERKDVGRHHMLGALRNAGTTCMRFLANTRREASLRVQIARVYVGYRAAPRGFAPCSGTRQL
eukprot:6181590-Pleurochrysis_carterae.AAC.2